MAHQYSNIWNSRHLKQITLADTVKYDDWLVGFENIIDSTDGVIIDLGCGTGNNTLYLMERNMDVISCDYSHEALDIVKRYIPNSKTKLFDMTNKFPFGDNCTQLVVADLCLHYFSEQVTTDIINELRRVLKPNGNLIFRVNSVNDTNHGAMQGKQLEDNFFFVSGMTKRFFDKKDILRFFADWEIEYINEEITGRFDKPKTLWKCTAKNTK